MGGTKLGRDKRKNVCLNVCYTYIKAKIMKQLRIKFLTLVFLLNCATNQNFSNNDKKEKYFIGEGKSFIVSNDRITAKKEAIHEAQKEVVQKGVGVYIKSKSESKDFQLVYSKIIAESEGYIENYEIISESEEDGFYKVKISGKVSNDKLETAFSQRITKFIESNLFGPCMIELTIYNRKLPNTSIYCPINDPTVDMDSIEVNLPSSGWIKPKIYSYGTINSFTLDQFTKSEPGYFIKDSIILLEKKLIEVKYKNPNSNQTEVKTFNVDKFNNLILKEKNVEIVPMAFGKKFSMFKEEEFNKIFNYFVQVAKENGKDR